jgi:transposase
MMQYRELMRESKDKKYFRLKLAQYAKANGIKAAARMFGCSRNTVRQWLRRHREGGYQELNDISRRPEHSPGKLSAEEIERIVSIKKGMRTVGAERLRKLHDIDASPRTMRKYWRERGIGYNIRKKHKVKNDLRAMKAARGIFAQIQVDTKHLNDIPEYWESMVDRGLPRYQYTAREVVSGLQMIGYTQELSLSNSLTFVDLIARHLRQAGVDPSTIEIQPDNGSEFIGSVHSHNDSVFTKYTNANFAKHVTIPPGKSNYQADVETVHGRIENEFYCIEPLTSLPMLMRKASTYIAWYNLLRENSYKDNFAPWQIILSSLPTVPKSICFFPIVLLDSLFDSSPTLKSFKGGQYVRAELEFTLILSLCRPSPLISWYPDTPVPLPYFTNT